MSYQDILIALIPVFLFILAGYILRSITWLSKSADSSLLKLQINVFYPCLIFSYVFGNPALSSANAVLLPPLVGLVSILLGFLVGYGIAKLIGMKMGKGLRTFSFCTGIYNYGFISIPLVTALFADHKTTGTLMVHNAGVELAIWTVGIVLISGKIQKDTWKKVLNPPVLALIVGVCLNFLMPSNLPESFVSSGLGAVLETITGLGKCSIPIALMMIGASIWDLIREEKVSLDYRMIVASCFMRLLIMPALILCIAKYLPVSDVLKTVIIIQAGMPCAMFPIIMSRHYGGVPQIAVQLVLPTTALSVLTIPFWVTVGLKWVL